MNKCVIPWTRYQNLKQLIEVRFNISLLKLFFFFKEVQIEWVIHMFAHMAKCLKIEITFFKFVIFRSYLLVREES